MSNEGRASDAIIRILEQRTMETRADIRRPEVNGEWHPVELDFYLGRQHFAIEHTKLETFINQTRSAAQFDQLIDEIVAELSGHLPVPGLYRLFFPVETVVGRKDGLRSARSAIIEWVRHNARELYKRHPERLTKDREPHGHKNFVRGVPTGLTFEITLWREVHWNLDEKFDGRLLVARIAPADVEKQRLEQMVRALDRKCPKLDACKRDGARSVLILEDADLFLSNHVLVSDAFERACIGRDDLPDEVYQVSTTTDTWTVWQLKNGDTIELSERWWEFPEDTLNDITRR